MGEELSVALNRHDVGRKPPDLAIPHLKGITEHQIESPTLLQNNMNAPLSDHNIHACDRQSLARNLKDLKRS